MTSNPKPEFVDNRDGNTLAEALKAHLDWLGDTYSSQIDISIASGYFNPEGYFLIADQLSNLDKVRLLLGAEPLPARMRPKLKPGDLRDTTFNSKAVNEALKSLSEGLIYDRNILGFGLEIDNKLQKLIDFLETDKIEVRRYQKGFLHGKAFIFSDEEGLISGSSNFTAAGLTTNNELNLGRYDPTPVRRVKQWYEDLWEDSEVFDLASIYKDRFKEYDPYLIYLRVLWELYKDELEKEQNVSGRIPLTTFQQDGVRRANSIMDKYNGVLIADGVGLGKTFIGGTLIREVTEQDRQRALLICPAALRDGTWARFKDNHQLYMEIVSYEQFASDRQFVGEEGEKHISNNLNEYAMVVIDEAQAFRNPGISRAKALRKLLQGTPPKKLVLMSATPVNNSLWDLYYLLNYFIKQDAAFAHKGIMSLRKHFSMAQAEDPTELKPDYLFDVLDEVTVRRTRNFVKKWYEGETIPDSNGTKITIKFPKPHVNRIDYDLESMMPGLLEDFEEKVMPEFGEPELTLARYSPDQYRKNSTPELESSLIGLIRSSLLKRLESSPYAFSNTLRKMIADHKTFLQGIKEGWVLTTDEIHEWQETDNDESFEDMMENTQKTPVDDFNIALLEQAVKKDVDILESFLMVSKSVSSKEDTKLKSLVKALKDISQKALNEKTISDAELRNKQKVIVFSYYADTVDWIKNYLTDVIETDPDLAHYKNRFISIVGGYANEISREDAVFGFVPDSSDAPEGSNKDRFDILISTDVLAEGQNLQQCRNVINYDLPWNPMRLVQRHGRIDRIGSPHSDVYVGCIFPDAVLERLLVLEGRLRSKLAQAAASIGVESEVIPGGATGEVVFDDKLDEIKSILRDGDTSIFNNAGEDPHAHSGEEYRQELRKALESNNGGLIKQLPWAAGSGLQGGIREGHFFCCRVGDRLFLRFVPTDGGDMIDNTLECLRYISCNETTPRYVPDSLRESVYDAWDQARSSVYKEWEYFTDPINIQPNIRPLFRKLADHLRKYPPAEMLQVDLNKIIDSLEAPWTQRIEKELRSMFNSTDDSLERSVKICNAVKELALEPFSAPDPLPPIDEDEIKLICWLTVSI